MTDLLYGEVEEDLRAALRDLLAARCPASRVLDRCEGDEPYDGDVWRGVAVEMGLAGLVVPEDRGGSGATWREAAVVLEELGRSVAPVPYLGSAVVATGALLAVDDRALLPDLAAGATTAALAVPFAAGPGAVPVPTVRVDGDALTGVVRGVADALGVDTLLVPTDAGLYEVAGVEVERRVVGSLDLTRPLCDVALAGARGRLLAAGAPATGQAVRTALTVGAALLASEQLGVAQWCLDTTVDHVRSRYQFGRPVGSFQALKHRLADVWVEVNQARAAARYAAGCLADEDPDTPVAVALAQAYCSAVAVHAAEECVQLHGGLGFTWEHPAHLYLKRAKSASLAFGTADRHRATLATLADLTP